MRAPASKRSFHVTLASLRVRARTIRGRKSRSPRRTLGPRRGAVYPCECIVCARVSVRADVVFSVSGRPAPQKEYRPCSKKAIRIRRAGAARNTAFTGPSEAEPVGSRYGPGSSILAKRSPTPQGTVHRTRRSVGLEHHTEERISIQRRYKWHPPGPIPGTLSWRSWAYRAGAMQDRASELPGMHLLRAWVNRNRLS